MCIQLLFSGKKITIEVLDKYSVFEYGHEIARIVKSAMLEEQFDCLISDLRATWTKQRMELEEVHEMLTKISTDCVWYSS